MKVSSKVCLTGAGGFLGSHLARNIAEEDCELLLVTHVSEPPLEVIASGARAVSVSDDDWLNEVDRFAPTCFIHAATRFQVGHTQSDIVPMLRSNVEVGAQLLDVAHRHRSRFVTISSAWQSYQGRTTSPVNLYAATKQAFDTIADFYFGEGLDLRRLFVFDVYGPADKRRKLVPLLMEALRTGRPLRATSGRQLIDLTFVDDVVRAVTMMAFHEQAHKLINYVVKSGPLPVREVADILGDVVGETVPVNWGSIPDREKEMIRDWNLEPVLPDWKPEVTLRDGLRRSWEAHLSK